MNPDNPTFRTPEEEARAQEFVKLKAENERLKRVIEKLREQRNQSIRDHFNSHGRPDLAVARIMTTDKELDAIGKESK